MPAVADLAILLVLLVGVYIGLVRGLYGPLATEGALVLAILVVSRLHTGLDSSLPVAGRLAVSVVLVGILAWLIRVALSPVVAIMRRTPLLGTIDRPTGGLVHGVAALLLMYLLLGVILDFDRNVYPLLQAGVVTAHQLQDYRRAVEQRPWLRGYVDDQALRQQQSEAARQPVTVDTLARVEGFLNFYLQVVRNPLLKSRLAPIINRLGSQVPAIGHPRPYLAGAVPQ
ncbi:MAG: CvpA family protein [Candidatus Dormibacteraeota bacterium]|nr:CvpA family protein [Candidatus Dormibacteraeota bacterium]